MSFLVIYAIVIIISLSIYLFSTNNLTLNDFNDSYRFLRKGIVKDSGLSKDCMTSVEVLNKDSETKRTGHTLNKGLKHLEFIGELESYLHYSAQSIISTDFLNEVKDSKLQAQLLVLKSTYILSTECGKKAA
ncbi:hypothetical protein FBALC1_02137 [Flavobacteriales bacterium ALC-1]|nr:hypothetical protein FBALC1_02137 [Flavobacteriales bacterium ALC-1]